MDFIGLEYLDNQMPSAAEVTIEEEVASSVF